MTDCTNAAAAGCGAAVTATEWCPCYQRHDAPHCPAVRLCRFRYPSRHPGLWVDRIYDHVWATEDA